MSINDKKTATVVFVNQHCSDTRSVLLQVEKPFSFTAGQFIMLNVPYKTTFVRRAYSIASAPQSGVLEICLNLVPEGIASNYIFGLHEGDKILFDGPWGVFKVRKNSNKEKWFVATGTGIAPLRSMIHDLLDNDVEEQVTLVFGERTEEELLYRAEFEQLALKHSHFHYIPTLSRPENGWAGEKGYVQHTMKKYLKKPQHVEVYICGLKEMVDDVQSTLFSLGVDARDIFTEKFV